MEIFTSMLCQGGEEPVGLSGLGTSDTPILGKVIVGTLLIREPISSEHRVRFPPSAGQGILILEALIPNLALDLGCGFKIFGGK